MITDGTGIPLATTLTGGNRHDVTQLMPLIHAIPPVRGRRGRPRRRPQRLYADRAYDHDKYRKLVRAAGITPLIARRGQEHGSGLGVHRWVVEGAFAFTALVPASTHPMGDPRRHPRSLSSPSAAPSSAGTDSKPTQSVRTPNCFTRAWCGYGRPSRAPRSRR
ncbi:Mobile element protein [Amycolatopsis azurea DSM 43854]|uniref:Mobile element protein n=1 Tax=Amycolatopsis azurea DSM 43854 TaxID=1238180 RepID=M2QD38_9PSEU|nr:Mobile element protein [Amycolatopsis azurea DSM 43854]